MNYVLNEEKMFADVTDGIAIIINSETGLYYGMNEFATNIYENIISGVDTDKLLNSLKEFCNTNGNIEDSYNQFLTTMLETEILVEGGKNSKEPNIDLNVAKENNYSLELKEYNDAQELLLADPIHEVKEETGWTPEKDSIGYTKEETAEREKRLEEQ